MKISCARLSLPIHSVSGLGERKLVFESVVARIRNNIYTLTPSEAKAAEYCRDNPEVVLSCSINEVARRAEVSVASVSRLATTLGFKDWKEMRLNLARDLSVGNNPVYPRIVGDESDGAVIHKVFEGNIVSLKDTLDKLDFDAMTKVVKRIVKSERVVFFGSGGSGFLAEDEALRFSHLELAAESYTTEYQMMIQASRMKKGQVAFGFSNSGRSRPLVAAIAEARLNGAYTVGISNFPNTPLENSVDVYFSTAFENGGGISASLTARIALSCLMDAVYVLCVHHGRMSQNVMRINKVLEDNLRFSRKDSISIIKKGRKGNLTS